MCHGCSTLINTASSYIKRTFYCGIGGIKAFQCVLFFGKSSHSAVTEYFPIIKARAECSDPVQIILRMILVPDLLVHCVVSDLTCSTLQLDCREWEYFPAETLSWWNEPGKIYIYTQAQLYTIQILPWQQYFVRLLSGAFWESLWMWRLWIRKKRCSVTVL